MATTTPNFGWPVPTSTDLVKDGATAIESLGDSIDASLLDLKGGTTGQVLAKNSNSDMDFIWSADAAGMTNPMTTTGDIIYSSSGSTPARRGVGTTGQVLTVVSGVPNWATPGGVTIATVRKSADQSVTNNDTPVDDTHLKFAIGANETYLFQLWIYPTAANSTPNMNYFVAGPSGSTTLWSPPDVYTASGGMANATVPAANTALSHYVDSFGRPAVIFGSIANGSTAGDVQFKWAQNTSSATSTTVKAGSFIYGIKVS
jgi:hypothetical protein